MKTVQIIEGTNVKYTFFNKQGLLTIMAGVAVTVGALLLERKLYFDGIEDAKEVMGVK